METTLNYSPVIEIEQLKSLLATEIVILVDVSNGKNAKENYEDGHLQGAIFIDLNTQLADIKSDFSLGGRHPLPSIQDFVKTLSNVGIEPNSHIVIYDDKNASNAAARFWWMLKAIGHEKVQVLNGGFTYAKKNGFPISEGTTVLQKANEYPVKNWVLPTVNIDEVELATADSNSLIIDVRDERRYKGLEEPIDLIAGHIPNAINIPFTENLDENGLFLKPEKLREKYKDLLGNKSKVIVHCGSGVTACHTLLAMAYAGMTIPSLYVGSWSEWSRNNKAISVEQ